MTRIYLGRDEWWPVPDPRLVTDDDLDGSVEIEQAIITRYKSARADFAKAWLEIAGAAAEAGDKYWQDNT